MDTPTLTDKMRERIVLALTSTTREKCRGFLAFNEKRCGMGVVLEALGFVLILEEKEHVTTLEEIGWVTHEKAVVCNSTKTIRLGDGATIQDVLPLKLMQDIMNSNDCLNKSFDEIAKMVKDWQAPTDYTPHPRFTVTVVP